jgi:iron complex outermembrane receptor protein
MKWDASWTSSLQPAAIARWLAPVIALGAMAGPTWAVDQSVPTDASSTGPSESTGLQEVVVTARRRSENLQTEPLSVQAVTGAQLEDMHVTQLSDLTDIANVNFNNQPGFMNTMVPFIRGIGEQDPVLTNDSPVALYVNGVLYARQEGMNFDLVDPQSVEVLRGPQGSLFGRNTTGGAIIITLPEPRDEAHASVKAGYASNHEITVRSVLESGLIGDTGLKALLGVEYHSMDGDVKNALDSDPKHWPGSDESSSVYLDLHGNLGSIGNFDLRGDYLYTLSSVLSGQTIISSPAETAYFSNSPAYGGNPYNVSFTREGTLDISPSTPLSAGKFGGFSLTLDFPINGALEVKSISAFRKLITDVNPSTVGQGVLYGPNLNAVTFAYNGITQVTPYNLYPGLLGRPDGDLSRQEQFSQELQFSGELPYNKYVGGLFAFDEEVAEAYIATLTIPLPVAPGTPLADAVGLQDYGGTNYWGHSESFAVYASDSFTPPILDEKLEFTGGARWTKDIKQLDYLGIPQIGPPYATPLPTAVHEASFSDPSGDFTAKYQWTPDLMSYVRFANAYKSGGFSGRDAYNAPGYKPETANNWEIGGKSDWLDHRIRFNADLFYTIYNNKQVTTYGAGLGSNGINESHIVNAGKAVYPGGEAELIVQPVSPWEVDVNYGHVNPEYKTFSYQPVTNGPVYNIASTAKFAYFSNTSLSVANIYTVGVTPVGTLSARLQFDYKSQEYWHPSDLFNPLNEAIKGHSQNLLSASIDLAHIPVPGLSDFALSLYGKNLTNRQFIAQAVDYEILPGAKAGEPGYDSFGTAIFNRPRVVGFMATGKF